MKTLLMFLSVVSLSASVRAAVYKLDPDHSSGFVLYDSLSDEVVLIGRIDLNTPDVADVNDNGFDDFFEVSEAGSGASTGTYTSIINTGPVRATWSRAAGSKDGTYALEFGSGQTSLGTYQGTFEILEYVGPLNYTAGSNKVSGAVQLLQTGAADNVLAGPIELTKEPTNRFDELILPHEVWTNASSQTFQISSDFYYFERDTRLKTNYYGSVDFKDGDLNTDDTDYSYWLLSIDDVNDSDNDGIPDFSDDPGSGTVRPSVLLSLGNSNLSFSISSTMMPSTTAGIPQKMYTHCQPTQPSTAGWWILTPFTTSLWWSQPS